MLTGFSLGCDDYIAKPFSVKEVLARVKALLKRTSPVKMPAVAKWTYRGLTIDIRANRVTIDDNEVQLTKKSLRYFRLCLRHYPMYLRVLKFSIVSGGEIMNLYLIVL